MIARNLVLAMGAHVAWLTLLYATLTVARAPAIRGIGRRPDGSNPLASYEPRISADLRNQLEWPILFYVVCLLLLVDPTTNHPAHPWLAWLFILGRILHTCVQVFTANVRLRGVVFTVNFVAVLVMWGLLFV
jgi:hypothetical protein